MKEAKNTVFTGCVLEYDRSV